MKSILGLLVGTAFLGAVPISCSYLRNTSCRLQLTAPTPRLDGPLRPGVLQASIEEWNEGPRDAATTALPSPRAR